MPIEFLNYLWIAKDLTMQILLLGSKAPYGAEGSHGNEISINPLESIGVNISTRVFSFSPSNHLHQENGHLELLEQSRISKQFFACVLTW
jgi:hypothetical protein